MKITRNGSQKTKQILSQVSSFLNSHSKDSRLKLSSLSKASEKLVIVVEEIKKSALGASLKIEYELEPLQEDGEIFVTFTII